MAVFIIELRFQLSLEIRLWVGVHSLFVFWGDDSHLRLNLKLKLYAGIVGMRGSMAVRLRPCMP